MNQQELYNMQIEEVQNDNKLMAKIHIWFENLPNTDNRKIIPVPVTRQFAMSEYDEPMEKLKKISNNMHLRRKSQFKYIFKIWLSDPISKEYLDKWTKLNSF